jgi:hypothetical protein
MFALILLPDWPNLSGVGVATMPTWDIGDRSFPPILRPPPLHQARTPGFSATKTSVVLACISA